MRESNRAFPPSILVREKYLRNVSPLNSFNLYKLQYVEVGTKIGVPSVKFSDRGIIHLKEELKN